MWLNVGAGDFPAPEPWRNVDVAHHRHPSICASIAALPFPDHTIDRIYAGHVLEHVPILHVVAVLRELRRVLRSEGRLLVVGPDVKRSLGVFASGGFTRQAYDEMLQGSEGNSDEHQWPCTEQVVVQLMQAAGFECRRWHLPDLQGSDWPITAHADWQLAVEGIPC